MKRKRTGAKPVKQRTYRLVGIRDDGRSHPLQEGLPLDVALQLQRVFKSSGDFRLVLLTPDKPT
jgi:hypothetical protein